jgi:N-methylhydantoinase A
VLFEDGWAETPVHDRAALREGHRFEGPALIEEPASVTVVRPGQPVRIDRYGNILIGEIARQA